MTKTLTILYQTSRHHRERIFATIIAAIVFCAFAYAFLLQKAIVNVIQREKISKEDKSISINVRDLEEKYFSIKNTITQDLARLKGLKNPEVISYISRRPPTAMASNHEL